MPDATTIFGPPGTGKTTRLAQAIEHASQTFGPDRVIVASLTKTAATEIINRGIPVNPENAGTLHAICYRALGRPKVIDGDRNLIEEFNRMYSRALTPQDVNPDDLGGEQADGRTETDLIREEMNLLRVRMIPRDLWPAHVVDFAEEWDAFKSFSATIDFTDMIEHGLRDLPVAPGSPGAIFYDEAQDGSALELALIRQWAEHTDHTVIAGDDDQALYAWRGASVEAFLGFSERKRYLERSYRLPRLVHAYAQRWAEQIGVREPKAYQPRELDGELVERPYLLRYPEQWITGVESLLDAGKSVMLLATCRYMLSPLVALLKKRGLPFHNPYRLHAGDWNPLGGSHGVGPGQRLLAYAKLAAGGNSPWTWTELHRWTDPLRAEVLSHGAKARLAERSKDPEIAPYGVVRELLGPDALAAAMRGDLEWYERSLLASKQRSLVFPLRAATVHGIPALRKHMSEVQGHPGKGLIVGTVHSVKGGEADVVYLWPDLSPAAMEEWYDSRRRDTVLRTLYVGITRAREAVVLCEPGSGMAAVWLPVEVASAAA